MSTIAPAQPPATPAQTAAPVTKTDRLIDERITEACRVLWWAEVVRGCLRLVLGAMLWMLIWLIVDQWIYSPGIAVRVMVWFAAIAIAGSYLWIRIVPLLRSQIRPEYAARSLERDLPELRQSLTSYVTLRRKPAAAGLRGRVVRSIGASTAGRLRTYDELPTEATGTLRWWIATAAGLAVLFAYAVMSPKNSFQSAARLAAPLAAIDAPRRVSIRDVAPGDAEAIAGRAIAVSAIIDGMNKSETAVCRWTLPSERREVALRWDENDRRFHGEIDLPYSVAGDVPYTIAAGDAEAGPFHLNVDDLPAVALQSVHYLPPAYTGQEPHTTSSGAITALDGTQVTITATTNRPVEKAKIEFNPRTFGDRMQATAGTTEMTVDPDGTTLTVSFPLRSARGRSAAVEPDSYRIQVSDQAGQTNPEPIVYPIRVIADLPPEVSITLPFQSPTEVAIDAQQIIEVHASDPDFGLKTIGLEVRSGIDMIASPVLWEDPVGGKGNQVVEFAFRPTRYQLRIGDEVQVVAVAIDNRVIESNPTVEPNTTRTDPIVLKIAAGDPNRPQDEIGEDRPPQRNDGSQEQSSQSGQQDESQTGQGGGGSNQDATGQSQSQQNQGEGGSGQGETSQDSESNPDGTGANDNAADGTDDSQDSSAGGNQTSGNQTSGNQTGETSGDAQSSESQSSESPPSDGTTGENQAAQDQQGGSEGSQAADQSTGQSTGQGADTGATQQPSADAVGDNSDAASSSDTQQSGAPDSTGGQGGTGQGGQQQPRQAPQHDGEAFERIREYMENQQQQQAEGSAQSPSETESQTSQTGESQTGESQTGESQTGESQTGESQTGESQTGESQTGESQTGESQTGESQTGESQTGESQTGESQTGESQTGESQTGESQTGESQTGESQTGESQTGESQTGESQTGESQTGESQTGESQTGESQTGESQTGESQTGESQTGESQTGESQTGESQTGESQTGESQTGESQTGESQTGESQTGESQTGESQTGESQTGESQTGESQTGESQTGESQSAPSAGDLSGDPRDSGSRSSSTPRGGAGEGSDVADSGQQGDSAAAPPPAPANLEYTKQATDMVLNYLEETRDAPDRKLLEELQWDEQDLKRFSERWRRIRELTRDAPAGTTNPDVEEALRSLGLRPSTDAPQSIGESADALRGIRDSGNRKPPPAAFRDAFDAFRRSLTP